nr:immunoglobulin light chain junction region [Macaca mulatta]MOV74232.1 immunoglobulin light chain junction region [Macaca mulatta]MOV74439.1 immunoglobulin light chain junction region [Macaca mulatta]MOV74696.1 immunoglobulin light chain junction region [Macaca mulatta]MOV74706.1 immunoglobulin light chain junction region [Macaca mulatta]
CQHHYTYPWTF